METHRSSPSTKMKNSLLRKEDVRGPNDDDDDKDDDEDWTRQQSGINLTNNCNRRLSFDGSVSERGRVLERRTQSPQEKIVSVNEEDTGAKRLSSGQDIHSRYEKNVQFAERIL